MSIVNELKKGNQTLTTKVASLENELSEKEKIIQDLKEENRILKAREKRRNNEVEELNKQVENIKQLSVGDLDVGKMDLTKSPLPIIEMFTKMYGLTSKL